MELLRDFWWVIPIFLVGVVINAIKDLSRIDHEPYLNKPKAEKMAAKKSKSDAVIKK